SVLSREKLLARTQVVTRLPVVDFDVRSHILIAQTQIQRQITTDLEIVLDEEAFANTALAPADGERLAYVVGKPDQKVRNSRAGIVHADLLRIRPVEIEGAEDAIVGPVEAILTVAQNLRAHLEDVPPVGDRQAVRILKDRRCGDAVCATRADAAGVP